MAKEIAIGKRAKISEAQQQTLLAVLVASVALGAGVALSMHFINQISFNAKVIAAEEQSIAAYSDVIKSIGICEKPRGSTYSDNELAACDPDSIEVSQIPDTLRANILEDLAASKALNSVPKEGDSGCLNADGKALTYAELNKFYQDAEGSEALQEATNLIRKCSALRIIPDALPSFKNEEALLSSLNKLFLVTGIEPEALNPGENSSNSDVNTAQGTANLSTLPLVFRMEGGDAGVVANLFRNLERSIRDIDVDSAHLEFNEGKLTFNAKATAYYTSESTVNETTKTITEAQ